MSAFDRNLAVIPLKGQVLTQTARFWFEATQSLCPNHVIEYPDPNVLVSKRLAMMPVEKHLSMDVMRSASLSPAPLRISASLIEWSSALRSAL